MASILKTFAIAAGAGVALGICTSAGTRRRSVRPRTTEHDVLDLEPLLDRLEAIERRVSTAAAAPPAAVVKVSELNSRIDAQEAEIERLRTLVEVRALEIEQRLGAEMNQRSQQALAEIEKTVELKVSERIAAIERSLQDQAASIESLRDHALETDTNLKRLITAIERLCERTEPLVTVAATVPAAGPVAVPRAKQEDEMPAFRSTIFTEEEAPKKTRFPLARIFGMIALVALTQFLSH